VSETIRIELMRSGIHEKKILVIPNGIREGGMPTEEDRRRTRREVGITENATVVGVIGRLSEEKGVRYLIESSEEILRESGDVTFMIVGEGVQREVLEKQARKVCENVYGEGKEWKKRFVFTGFREDVSRLLSSMDILVLPSIVEGLPMALLEGMAAAKPVVATQVGAVPDVVKDGETGVLVAPQKPSALSEAIKKLLGDGELSQRMGRRGRERIIEEYSASRMAERYAEMYGELSTSLRSEKGFSAIEAQGKDQA